MRITSKSRFAVTAMIDLGLREGTGPVALTVVAEQLGVSLSYLEQLFARLRRDGLVASTRGPGGGYELGRSAAQISIADIVGAVEDDLDATDLPAGRTDLARGLWSRLTTVMLDHLRTVTLRSVVEEQLARGVSVPEKPVRRAIGPSPVVQPPSTSAPNSVFSFGQSFAS